MRKYKVTKKQNQRKGQAEKVIKVVAKHGPLTTAEILGHLKKDKADCIRFHISQLFRGGFLAVSK
jgi:hypothetical protein